jgi:hypothetical protein
VVVGVDDGRVVDVVAVGAATVVDVVAVGAATVVDVVAGQTAATTVDEVVGRTVAVGMGWPECWMAVPAAVAGNERRIIFYPIQNCLPCGNFSTRERPLCRANHCRVYR